MLGHSFFIYQLFVNNDHLFTIDNLSHIMACSSIEHLSFKMIVNPWHYISIAFKQKLGHFIDDLMDTEENDTIEALQAGHSYATENQIYDLSPDALAGPVEDILPLYLEASTRWQVIMCIVSYE